jgi:hypothetical protein
MQMTDPYSEAMQDAALEHASKVHKLRSIKQQYRGLVEAAAAARKKASDFHSTDVAPLEREVSDAHRLLMSHCDDPALSVVA